MVFNSIFFIFCFLPVFMLIYYLVPGKLRKRNSSLNLPYVAQAIAELKGITAEEVIDVTRQNAEKLLGIHQ